MKILQTMKELFTREATHWTMYEFDDPNAVVRELLPEEAYLRFWVTDMFVTHDREWFKAKSPAVNVSLQMSFANQPAIKFSKVTRAKDEIVTRGAFNDYAVMDLIPYRGGLVTIDAALFTVDGANELTATLDILEGFSGLVAAPFGQALAVVNQVNQGIEKFLDVVNGDVQLAYERTFASAGGGGDNSLTAGYIVVVAAPLHTYPKENFELRGSKLYYRDGHNADAQPFDQANYVLFRIEGRKERDDFAKLKNIEDAKNQARKAIIEKESAAKASALQRATILAVYDSPDLTKTDKTRVITAILEEFKEAKELPLGAVLARQDTDLQVMMKMRAVSAATAEAAPLTLEDALQSID